MFFIPMIFMLCATLTSLVQTIIKKFQVITTPDAVWGDWFQLIFALAMTILAIILVIEGIQTFSKCYSAFNEPMPMMFPLDKRNQIRFRSDRHSPPRYVLIYCNGCPMIWNAFKSSIVGVTPTRC